MATDRTIGCALCRHSLFAAWDANIVSVRSRSRGGIFWNHRWIQPGFAAAVRGSQSSPLARTRFSPQILSERSKTRRITSLAATCGIYDELQLVPGRPEPPPLLAV